MKRWMAIVLAACMCCALTACGEKGETAEAVSLFVETAAPERGEIVVSSTYIGTVAPQEEVSVYPLVSGTVTEINFQVGDSVSEGDVLFKIDDTAAQLQLDSANASYGAASASANLATGGSRHLQSYQTEEGIDTIEENLDDVRDAIKEMESQIDNSNTTVNSLTEQADAAKAAQEIFP